MRSVSKVRDKAQARTLTGCLAGVHQDVDCVEADEGGIWRPRPTAGCSRCGAVTARMTPPGVCSKSTSEVESDCHLLGILLCVASSASSPPPLPFSYPRLVLTLMRIPATCSTRRLLRLRGFATTSSSPRVPQTVIEKVVQKYAVDHPAGKAVKAGDYVMIRPEHVMTHDNTGPVISK